MRPTLLAKVAGLVLVVALVVAGVAAAAAWMVGPPAVPPTVPAADRDAAAQLRAEFTARWGITVQDQGLDQSITPLVARPGMPVHLADLPPQQEAVALGLVRDALSVYPSAFVRAMLHTVVLAGDVTVFNEAAGGLYFDHAVAVNFRGIENPASRGFDVDTVHHELSSIVRRAVSFNVTSWEALNPPGFHYMDAAGYRAVLADAGSVEGDAALHQAGFVSRYGQTTLDNDWNTYAERVFGHGEDLARMLGTYPAMRAKTRILLDVYLSLDPGFEVYFERTGLRRAVGPA